MVNSLKTSLRYLDKFKQNLFYSFMLFWGLLAALILMYAPTWINLYPMGDEIALISSSQRFTADWVLSGFSEYFKAYPEWTIPYSDFIRPGFNITYWLFSPWSENAFKLQLILVNYGTHAVVAALIFFISINVFKNSLLQSLLLSLSLFFCAAFFNSGMPYFQAFAFDGMAALFCLTAIVLARKGYHAGASMVLLASILTKETALPILGAFILFAIIRRRYKFASYLAAALLIWLLLRLAAFGGFGEVYSAQNAYGLTRIAAIILLPFAYFEWDQLRALISLQEFPVAVIVFIVANMVSWVVLLKLFYQDFNYLKNNSGGNHEVTLNNDAVRLLLLLCILSSFVYLVVIRGEARFTYILITMLIVYLASLRKKEVTIIAACFLCISLLGAVVFYSQVNKDLLLFRFTSAREFIGSLKEVSARNKTVYVANDFVSGFSAPHNLARFSNVDFDIVRISSIDPSACSIKELAEIRSHGSREADGVTLTVRLPSCASFIFEGSRAEMMKFDKQGKIIRSDTIWYEFPELAVRSRWWSNVKEYDYGNAMIINIHSQDEILYYDFKKNKWATL
jgi:hypothetical protein